MESLIENHIRKIINDNIICGKNDFTILENKIVADIIICRNILVPKIFFIEVKHYSERNGRIGFGNSNGTGFQPEILIKKPKYFDDNLIWTFKNENEDSYYILKNEDCIRYVMGDNIGKKQNNFRVSLFQNIEPLKEIEYLDWIDKWLKRE